MKRKTIDEDSASINKVLNKILKEQEKIDQQEGNVIKCHIRLAHHLANLRDLAKKTWGNRLKDLGMNSRVASRYLKIAKYWPTEIGLNESDLLPRLPVDLLKLEWLCRVPLDRLPHLLDHLNCKKATRQQVIAAVREALGEAPPGEPESDVAEFVDRCIRRLMKTVKKLHETFVEPEEQTRGCELLETGLRQVQETLQSARETANHRSARTTAGSGSKTA